MWVFKKDNKDIVRYGGDLKNISKSLTLDCTVKDLKEHSLYFEKSEHFKEVEIINEDTKFPVEYYDEAIAELEEAMKPKCCDGCKYLNGVICNHDRGLYCVRQFEEDYFQPKEQWDDVAINPKP